MQANNFVHDCGNQGPCHCGTPDDLANIQPETPDEIADRTAEPIILRVSPFEAEELDEYSFQTWEEYEVEEWRRTCELTHEDVLRNLRARAALMATTRKAQYA